MLASYPESYYAWRAAGRLEERLTLGALELDLTDRELRFNDERVPMSPREQREMARAALRGAPRCPRLGRQRTMNPNLRQASFASLPSRKRRNRRAAGESCRLTIANG